MAFDDVRLGMLASGITGIGGGGGTGGGGGIPSMDNPEPSTYVLFAGGLAALAVIRRKRRNSA